MSSSLPRGFDDIQTVKSKPGRVANVIAVVVDALPPKLSGGDSYTSTFTLKDHDFSGETWNGLKIRYFQRCESDLPAPQQGDVVLLRQIKLRPYQGAVIGLCTQLDFSPWIIFRQGSNPKVSPQVIMCPGTRELMTTEKSYALSLIGAASTTATNNQPVQVRQTVAPAPPNPVITKPSIQRGRPKFSLIRDLSCGTFVDLVVQVVKTYAEDYQRFLLYVTDYTQNKQLFNYTAEEGGPRDGDVYGYTSRSRRTWPGPYGQMTLQVTLWEPHSYYARQNVKENDFVLLQNVNIKMGRVSGAMEGSLHTDRRFPEKVQVIPINDNDSDEDVKKLVKRKIDYWKRVKTENPGFRGNDINKRKATDNDEQQRCLTKAKKRQAEQNRKQEEKIKCDEDQPEIETSFQEKRDQLNAYIRANDPSVPCRSISDILSNESHMNISPDGIKYRLPFQNLRYKASVRVVDFFPPNIEDFSVQYDVERAMLSNTSDTEGSTSSIGDNETDSGKRWEWRFCLLVEDAGPGTHYNRSGPRERMKLYVGNNDAVFLLCLDAVNLRQNPAVLSDLREKLFILWGDLEERKRAINTAACNNNNNAGSNDDPNPDLNKQIIAASTKPFICCIKEFGVKSSLRSDEGSSANDECRFGWERRFCMFGTTIV
ncbi:telomere-binding alpha subunit central domain-containing protein [Histoplasma capsulatum G186AR]|uniref:Protection of telomeres protein 1 n=1 Tax=Ajellomyces capsulatus TaxID=5037 RepID=A0A8H7YF57_AJECA|nr:telomere-binding alpha subunit central domain-containing protein [Histoplasma capsulatum]QSS68553.1 telomere-binding alpha subunit central domain-containing protein [Histoplasma capsulatum G186AR]